MSSGNKYTARTFILEILTALMGILFLVPFYFVLVNSFKPFAELLQNTASLPKSFSFDNYSRVVDIIHFPQVMGNSLMITVLSNIGLVIFASMSAYRFVRKPSKLNNVLFLLFVAAMVIPFQSIMIPLVKVANNLGLMDSRLGLVVCYFGFGVSLNVFLFHGFIKSIPKEIEESATVDGCGWFSIFWRIVFPLLKPIAVTVILLNSLWIWNDYLLPSLVLTNTKLHTIPLATYAFFGQYTKQWDLAMAALTLGVLPIIIFFLLLQKHIIEGITAGSVKG
ncbi:carbohydrate ABC transporter permease [Paenibacillus sp. UNC499MF]|uniref:carbohydrate ABC transporter permease n=1 Tax=Paenibacillus sp. UNC499MF TaxID=1502751 RepID=UPI00089FC589|nr:carbohydrate ABC transporter permease [Paenibacillus sp. UNC499MF]SEG68265.1 raffinose/stachyose/melibiose transport system permease protein [Paenibacillus sp. UNC499MF]